MYLNLNTILLGAALATAAPFPSNSTLAHNGTFTNSTLLQRSTKSFTPAHWTNGSTSTNSTRRLTLSAEAKKCDVLGYVECGLNHPKWSKKCLEVLDKSGECTIGEIIDYTYGDGDGELSINVTSVGAPGGYQVGGNGKLIHAREDATVKKCNFKGYEECKAGGGKRLDCANENLSGCSILELLEYFRKNPEPAVGGYQEDGDAEVFSTTIKACNFKGYEECKAGGGKLVDCVKQSFKIGECHFMELFKHFFGDLKRINSTEDATGGHGIDGAGKLVYSDDA